MILEAASITELSIAVVGVLGAWGTSTGPEDINEDGTVDIDDLFAILAAWGPCI